MRVTWAIWVTWAAMGMMLIVMLGVREAGLLVMMRLRALEVVSAVLVVSGGEGNGGAVVGDGGVGDNVYVPEMGVGELGELGGV